MKAYRKTQNEKILEHLRLHGSITDVEAFELYSCRRLSGRIYDLRRSHNIRTEYTTKPNRYGIKTTFATYVLED